MAEDDLLEDQSEEPSDESEQALAFNEALGAARVADRVAAGLSREETDEDLDFDEDEGESSDVSEEETATQPDAADKIAAAARWTGPIGGVIWFLNKCRNQFTGLH